MFYQEIETALIGVVSKPNRRRLDSKVGRSGIESRMRRLIRRLESTDVQVIRDRLAAELDRIFRAAYRLRMKG